MANITGTSGNDTITPGLVSAGVVGGPVTTGADSVLGLDGNDVLDGGDGNDTLSGGIGDDSIIGGAGADLLLGGDGNDTLVAGASTGFNDTLAGGNGNDEIRGRSVFDPSGLFNFLAGQAGNDTLRGYGYSNNIVDNSTVVLGINANLTTGLVTIGAEVDTLDQVRGFRPGAGADTVFGTAFGDILFAGNGADSIDGAGGFDVINYGDASAAVTIDLAAERATDAGGAVDTLLGFEAVTGSNYNDRIVGNALDNRIDGLAGDDTLDGGAGYDTIRFASTFFVETFPQTQGAIVRLDLGTAVDPWGNTDVFKNFEAATGSRLNDDLTGAILASGEESNLRGLGGNDTLRAPTVTNLVAADYRDDGNVVRLNLGATAATLGGIVVAARTGRDGFGGTDSFVNIRTAIGSVFNDTIQGSEGDDRLYGWDGNDSLIGGAGDDSLYGGRGIDTYSGGTGYDLILFTPRSASETSPTQGVIANLATGLIANDGHGNAESIVGAAANDIEMLIGYSFNDELTGKTVGLDANGLLTRVYLRGSQGNDTLRAAIADSESVITDHLRDIAAVTVNLVTNTATDGWGNTDTLVNIGGARGSAFADRLTGNASKNWFRGEAGNDIIDGGGGVDLVSFSSSTGSVVLDLTAGTASDGQGGTDTLSNLEDAVGGSGADTLLGSAAGNFLLGLAGDDSIDGRGGNDSLLGGDGIDTLLGGAGIDTLRGEAGNDSLDGGGGADSLVGGDGDDTYVFSAGDSIVELAGGGIDSVQSAANAVLSAEVESLLLTGAGALTGTGNELGNTLTGNTANNLLSGLIGDDTLIGGAGADTLVGGAGADRLDGGTGLDVFRYANASEGGDTIVAFKPADDGFEISASGFGGGLFAGINIGATGRFVANNSGNATAAAGTGQFVFELDTDTLRWDADGKGAGAAVVIATIAGANPGALDFVVIG